MCLSAGSGCAALIYEIVWLQMIELVIGSSPASLGILLATFMGAVPRQPAVALCRFGSSSSAARLRDPGDCGRRPRDRTGERHLLATCEPRPIHAGLIFDIDQGFQRANRIPALQNGAGFANLMNA